MKETESLGMLLVNALTDQLDGRLTWNAGRGTVWTMTFPVDAAKGADAESRLLHTAGA